MKIGTKIFAGFLIVVLLMAISGGVSIYFLRGILQSSDTIQDKSIPLLLKTEHLAVNNGLKIAAMRGFLITGNEKFLNDYNTFDKEDEEILQELIDKAITAQGKTLAQESKQLDDVYQKIAFEKLVPLKRAGKMDEVLVVMNNELTPAAIAVQAKLKEYTKFREKQINEILENAQDEMKNAQMMIVGFLVIALVCAIVIAYVIIQGITVPIRKAIESLGKIATGDFTVTIGEQFLNAKDETGDMARAMDKMIVTMQDTIRKLSLAAEQLAASSEELTASAEQSAQAANQVATSIVSVAGGATEQMNAAGESAAVVKEMSLHIQQSAVNADQLATQSSQAAAKAKEGGKSVEKAVGQMVQIETAVNTSASVVGKLGERSKEIGQIVDTISGIAGQTNLLALNAAIEAARAGEQGRGFAVVAEEVRKLAEQSQEAAKRIADLIKEIQLETNNAVMAMNEGTREVRTGAEVVNVAGIAFHEIAELVTNVSNQVKEMSGAIQQMSAGSQQIVDAVQKIDQLSKTTASETQSVSAATEEQLASMEEISGASQALAQLAQGLQGIVATFRT